MTDLIIIFGAPSPMRKALSLVVLLAAIACVGPEKSSPTERVEVTSVEVVGEKKEPKKSDEKKK